MKQFSKLIISFVVFFLSLCMLPEQVLAQPGDPEGDPDTPIDGGVSILVAAGVVYGIKKIREERKKNVGKLP